MTIDEIRELEKKATKGPWISTYIGGPLNPVRIEVDHVGREGSAHIIVERDQKGIDVGFFGTKDAEFIAASRTAVPMLLEKLEKCRQYMLTRKCLCPYYGPCVKCELLEEVFGI